MSKISLIHPKHGVVAFSNQDTPAYKTVQKWKYRYGKKFYECEVKIDPSVKKRGEQRRVKDCKTGDIYKSIKDAAAAVGISVETARNHANKKIQGRLGYKVQYID